MKKILKKEVIIAFIIGIILASSIAVYAYSYAAKDIGYTKPGENTPISVETALNDLYEKHNNISEYDNKNYTQTGLSIFSDRLTFTNGGYYVDSENITWVNLTFKTNQALNGNDRWGLIKGLPNLNKQLVISDIENRYAFLVKDYGSGNLGEICYFNYDAISLPKDAIITLQFKY